MSEEMDKRDTNGRSRTQRELDMLSAFRKLNKLEKVLWESYESSKALPGTDPNMMLELFGLISGVCDIRVRLLGQTSPSTVTRKYNAGGHLVEASVETPQ